MKKTTAKRSNKLMRKEYDFSSGAIVGKYASRYASGANIILLDRDLARIFPDSKSVNNALRLLRDAALKASLTKRAARES